VFRDGLDLRGVAAAEGVRSGVWWGRGGCYG